MGTQRPVVCVKTRFKAAAALTDAWLDSPLNQGKKEHSFEKILSACFP